MKVLVALCFAMAVAAPAFAAQTPQAGRVWLYANGAVNLSPSLSLMVMPGTRYEYARSGTNPSRDHYLDELFIGPTYAWRLGDLGVKLSAWYYWLRFVPAAPADTTNSHSLELVPTLDYRLGALTLVYRAIFHNTFYASVYQDSERAGFGSVMRNLFLARYALNPELALLAGDEPWFGIIENHGTVAKSSGYWQKGYRLNRIYAGLDFRHASGISVSPQYVFETSVDSQGKLAERDHYLFVTVGYAVNVY